MEAPGHVPSVPSPKSGTGDIKPALKRGHYAVDVDLPPVTVGNTKVVRAFPGLTESTVRCLQNNI